MHKFCTLFDKNYLYKGLSLYFSLVDQVPNFHLWILCMDDITIALLQKMNLKHVSFIPVSEFENERLLAVKKTRTVAEYSWTATANLCWLIMDKINEGELITYLDADISFFSDPEVLFQEIGSSSIAIIEHRLQGARKAMEKYVGTYNVGWVTFRKDKDGLEACEWWKERVLEWCYARFERGKIGDQHYLNDWLTRFSNVRVINHEGADVAPWNITNQKVALKNDKVYVGKFPLIFYHFHSFTLVNKTSYLPAPAYYIPGPARRYIYDEYFKKITKAIELVASLDPQFNFGFKKKVFKSFIAQFFLNFRAINYLYIKYSCYDLRKKYVQGNKS